MWGDASHYHCPRIEEDSQLLVASVINQQQYPIASQDSSPTLPLVDDVVNLIQSSITSTYPSREECDATPVFLVSSDNTRLGVIYYVSTDSPPRPSKN